MTLTVGSLFAGVGGFDLAAEAAGMEVSWQSEVDPHASRVLDERWPEVTNYGDITQICGYDNSLFDSDGANGSERSPVEQGDSVHLGSGITSGNSDCGGVDCEYKFHPPRADVLVGGFPCQDYSVAGRRGGLVGNRGALWWDYHRLIAGIRPEWVVAENVPGLLSSNDGADFETIVGSLTDLGYGVVWRVFDAQWFGVAQRRRRLFIVGHSGGEPRPKVLALAQSLLGDPEPSREAWQDVAATLETRPTPDSLRTEEGHLVVSSSGMDIIGALTTEFGPKNYTNLQEVSQGSLVIAVNGRQDPSSNVELSPTLDGGHPTHVIAFSAGQSAGAGSVGAAIELAPTLRAGSSGTNQVPTIAMGGEQYTVRRLTPLECERLQGFLDDWTASQSDTQRYRQMGNAVAVPVVTHILKRISRLQAVPA